MNEFIHLVRGNASASNKTETAATLAASLFGAADMETLAGLLTEHARTVVGCRAATLVWWLDGRQDPNQYIADTLDAEQDVLVEAAIADPEHIARSADGRQFALSLAGEDSQVGAVLLASEDRLLSDAQIWHAFPELVRSCVSNALEKARLSEAVRRLEQAEKVQHALFAIADMASSDLDMPDMLRGLHQIVGDLMYAENFYIALYDPDKDVIRFIHFVDAEDTAYRDPDKEIPMSQIERGLTWYLIRDKHPLMGDTEQLLQQISGPLRIIGTDSPDWLGVPMLRGNTVRGVVVVQSYIERPRYTPADQALLSFVGSHILTALDRKQAQEELERRVEQRTLELTAEVQERQRSERLQATLFHIAELSNNAISLDSFYSAVHKIVGELLDSRNFYIAVLSEDGDELQFPYFVDEHEPKPQPRKLGRGITEYVLRSGKPMLADMTHPETRAEIENLAVTGELAAVDPDSVCWLGVPLVCSDRISGVLAVQSYTNGVTYTARDQELLTFISYQIANGLERQRAAAALKASYAVLEQRVTERTQELSEQIAVREQVEQRLKHEVLHDSLTGLPNRAYLRDHLTRALDRLRRNPHHRFAVLFMDLDRFKVINDSAGHLVGDALLKEVALRFASCVRVPDVVARLGGDEFAILMEDIRGNEDAIRVARRVCEVLHEPVRVDGKELYTSVSVGIAVSDGRYAEADELLRDADIAMYRAKANSHQCFELFDERLHQEALHLLDLEGELRRAIAREEFEPYFQPIVRLDDASVIGYEALLRWNHPERGVLAPGAFLRVAEANGSLEAIDWQMYQRSCALIPALLRSGEYVNLNFPPLHFRSADMDTRLLELLRSTGVRPEQVRIEVTEGALMDNPEQVSEILDRLRQAGVMTALDDFGTGYSSLSYLHRFQLHTLKIDRSFVIDLVPGGGGGGAAVVRAIIALSQSLGLEVVAEGIETAMQREALQALGCQFGQGYLFARPMPLAEIIAVRP
jgi:diguanylate cyclase (GGDEF)-like protein